MGDSKDCEVALGKSYASGSSRRGGRLRWGKVGLGGSSRGVAGSLHSAQPMPIGVNSAGSWVMWVVRGLQGAKAMPKRKRRITHDK